jgi:L-ascorbate metabolism protein UlaG (beta-lactamase superfamily)
MRLAAALSPPLLIAAFAFSQPYPVSDHFDGRRFYNPVIGAIDKSFGDMWRWRTEGGRASWPEWVVTGTGPVAQPRDGKGVAATFVNHATFVLRFGGGGIGGNVGGGDGAFTVLTDPIWSDRCSPFSFAGPRRVHAPGVPFDSLPRMDVVVISHNHYDHMDLPTLRRLAARDNPLFLVPLGDKKLLQGEGISRVEEMDWWQARKVSGFAITFLPAQHWSARGLFDRNESLWGSWGIVSPDGTRVYHAGDTGYGSHFKTIRARWGVPDLALIPIGAYAPRWFMGAAHVDPAEAIQAFHDLGARKAVGMHFGAFQLTNESWDEPATRTRELAGDLPFRVPEPGQAFHAVMR